MWTNNNWNWRATRDVHQKIWMNGNWLWWSLKSCKIWLINTSHDSLAGHFVIDTLFLQVSTQQPKNMIVLGQSSRKREKFSPIHQLNKVVDIALETVEFCSLPTGCLNLFFFIHIHSFCGVSEMLSALWTSNSQYELCTWKSNYKKWNMKC